MKITDTRGKPVRFGDIKMGVCFYDVGEEARHQLEMKVLAASSDGGHPHNAVCLNTGQLVCVTRETRVQVVDAEIIVRDRAEE